MSGFELRIWRRGMGWDQVLAANRTERESWLAHSMQQQLEIAEIELLRHAGILLERLALSDLEKER